MLKIAYSGMKGRKKDTFLMGFVILLSIIFVITSTTLYSSSEATKHQEKVEKYGTWRTVAHSSDLSSILPTTTEQLYPVKIIGDSLAGKVATLPEGFQDQAHFQLIEGTLPTALDEIALEYRQTSQFPQGIKVGDTIPLRISFIIHQTDQFKALVNSYDLYFRNYGQEIYDFANEFPEHDVTRFIDNYNTFFMKERIPFYLDTTQDNEVADFLNTYNLKTKEEMIKVFLEYDLYQRFCKTQGFNRFYSQKIDNMQVDQIDKIQYTFFSPSTINFGETNRQTKPQYNTALSEQEIVNRGATEVREVAITIPFKVTGFIENYTETWYGTTEYPNAYITGATGEKILNAFHSNETIDTSKYKQKGYVFSNLTESDFSALFPLNTTIEANQYMYPTEEAPSERTFTIGILALIIVATIAAVFQINLTQMKRRTRKIVLLKSIGAVKSQLRQLMISEMLLYFCFTIPLGILVGLLGSYGLTIGLKNLLNIPLNFSIDFKLLIFGVLLSIIAVILGMSFPLIKALNVPLTGTMNETQRKYTAKTVKNPKVKALGLRKLTFKRISIAHMKRERKKHYLTFALNTVTIVTLLITIVLSYIAYVPYIDNVVGTNAPDFSIEMNFGISNRDRTSLLEELNALSGVESTDFIQFGEKAYMYNGKLFGNKPYSEKFSMPSYREFVNITPENEYLIKKARFVTCYGIDESSTVMEKLLQSGAAETLNMDKFISGEEVILILPAYNDKESTVSFLKKGLYSTDYAISVGDTFDLTIPTENRVGTSFTNDVAFHQPTVGAIINSFDGEGVWNLSQPTDAPIVVTSLGNLSKYYTKVSMSPNLHYEDLMLLISQLEPTKNGHTRINIYAKQGTNLVEMESSITRLSNKYFVKPIRHYVSNEVQFNTSLKLAMIIIVLGVSIAVIALLILYNTTLSKIESERERIGTLQSLGVTHAQFKGLYTATGIVFGMASLILGCLLSGLVLIALRGGFGAVFQSQLSVIWLFPWTLTLGISISFVIICILTYYLPIKKALKVPPIHNISGLQK